MRGEIEPRADLPKGPHLEIFSRAELAKLPPREVLSNVDAFWNFVKATSPIDNIRGHRFSPRQDIVDLTVFMRDMLGGDMSGEEWQMYQSAHYDLEEHLISSDVRLYSGVSNLRDTSLEEVMERASVKESPKEKMATFVRKRILREQRFSDLFPKHIPTENDIYVKFEE